jgi:carboxyl-terminal processing protease
MSAGAVEVLRAALPGASLGEPPGNSVPLGTALPRLLDPLAVGAVGSKYGRAALELTALNGALAKLDPHTLLFSPEEYAELTAATNGKFGGLGIVLSVRDGALKVMSVIPGTPAAIGELAAGDTITRIGTQDTDGLPIDKAVTLLRGDPGSKIEITVRPEGAKQARRVELTRQIIRIQNVESRKLEGGIGYVLLKQFNAETEKNLTEHLAKLEEGGGLSGLVLDLRGNPGGLLDQAVKVADRFLAHGEIVTTAGRVERQRKDATVQPADILEVPMVVLVSYGSASSSEVVAAALQANDRAVVMGERTFGKGTVQVIYNLKHGFAMKMTIAQYVTGGRAFEEVGIQPDIVTLSSRAVERRDTRDRGERTAAVVINYTAEDKGALAEYPIELARKVLSSSGRKDRKAMLAASRSLLEYESKAGR